MSLLAIRRALLAALVSGAVLLAWSGHPPPSVGASHAPPAPHLLADGGLPGFPPPPA